MQARPFVHAKPLGRKGPLSHLSRATAPHRSLLRPARKLSTVSRLTSWELNSFRREAFVPAAPHQLRYAPKDLPIACSKWFLHNDVESFDINNGYPSVSKLRSSFWAEHEDAIVPLELTTETHFQRSDAPLRLLLSYLDQSTIDVLPTPFDCKSSTQTQSDSPTASPSIYLAQCDLRTLPAALQADVPTPSLVSQAGKGDLYASSLWLGRPPTYTPLHRDPNPNLFVQLAGMKTIRLVHPQVGRAIFEHAQALVRSHGHSDHNGAGAIHKGDAITSSAAPSPSLRGEEMMQGLEKQILHDLVWSESHPKLLEHMLEAKLSMGDALFIPMGWWHSVKSVGEKGVSASVNWWFR